MNLTRNQFDVLSCLAQEDKPKTQREISDNIWKSVGTVNKIVSELSKMSLIKDGAITHKGLYTLEPYRVKRAVFIAAGFGLRMVPITLNTPKPLVRVHGVRMIDTLLDAVVAAGIEEIYIVRGYLGEQFDQLLAKYPQIKFLDNPMYNEANNISSALVAKDLLQNSYVLEADFVLSNPKLISRYQFATNYLGVPVERTDDWCFTVKDGFISKLAQGGTDCFHMFGISYWTESDGKRLSVDIEKACNLPGGMARYWDQVPLEYFIKDYHVEVRRCSFDDIVEIDSFNELKKIDNTYDAK
ncbi:MAG: sugar phosphate nucleotidyltransferase [Candidatus Cloacimonetes bacterium]|nr:sugar phosphate nucleotidyltransferase [Candidatus Cloacimonadota bacterium]